MHKSQRIAVFFLIAAVACSDTADTSPEKPPQGPPERVASVDGTTPADSSTRPTCGIDGRTALTPTGIGDLRVGMPVAQARARCRVLGDSVGEAEGMPMPLLVVDLGRDTALAEPANDRIFRLRIDGSAFRTLDGLGVGSTVGDLRAKGSARVALGEGTFILLAEKCGLSFELGEYELVPGARFGPNMSAADIAPDSRVVRVLVYMCDPSHPVPSPR
ncbi:MAG: hypothetical protein ACR2L6_10130 [Gemmatimonadaceae bacterium]